MRLVLDTNVVLELLHWQDPRCALLAQAIDEGRAICLTDAECLAELRRVLAYPQIRRSEAEQEALHATYAALAQIVPPGTGDAADLPKCRDADDQKFLLLAARSKADLLLTRDRELLRLARSRRHPPPFAIATPEQAAERISAA